MEPQPAKREREELKVPLAIGNQDDDAAAPSAKKIKTDEKNSAASAEVVQTLVSINITT